MSLILDIRKKKIKDIPYSYSYSHLVQIWDPLDFTTNSDLSKYEKKNATLI